MEKKMLESQSTALLTEQYGRNYNVFKEQAEEMMSRLSLSELHVKEELYQWLVGQPFQQRSSDSVLLQKGAFVENLLRNGTAEENDEYFADLQHLSYKELTEKKDYLIRILTKANPGTYNKHKSDAKETLLKIEAFMKKKTRNNELYPLDTRKTISMKELLDELYVTFDDGVRVLKYPM